MKVETLHAITGIFKNCTLEPALDGWSVFDAKKRFICIITTVGVSLSDTYEHSEVLKIKLAGIGVDFWSDEIKEEIKLLVKESQRKDGKTGLKSLQFIEEYMRFENRERRLPEPVKPHYAPNSDYDDESSF